MSSGTSLSLTLQTLFDVSAKVSFSVPRAHPGYHTAFNHTITNSPPVSSVFPCFSWLFLSCNGQRFRRISLTLGWSDVCLVILLGLPVLREKATEMKGSSLHDGVQHDTQKTSLLPAFPVAEFLFFLFS